MFRADLIIHLRHSKPPRVYLRTLFSTFRLMTVNKLGVTPMQRISKETELEYDSMMWSPFYAVDVTSLEKMNSRFVTKFASKEDI